MLVMISKQIFARHFCYDFFNVRIRVTKASKNMWEEKNELRAVLWMFFDGRQFKEKWIYVFVSLCLNFVS